MKFSQFALVLIVCVDSLFIKLPRPVSSQFCDQLPSQQLLKLTDKEMYLLARAITVKVQGGSGILVNRQESTYTVVTNLHVVRQRAKQTYRVEVFNPDKQAYDIYDEARLVEGSDFQDNDLALLEFNSDVDYELARLGNSKDITQGEPILSGGFPSENDLEDKFSLKTGSISLILTQPMERGYRIGYYVDIIKGMSGGPLLNLRGEVIGINGQHSYPLWGYPYRYKDGTVPDHPREQMIESSWAIPINTFWEKIPASLDESITDRIDSNSQLARNSFAECQTNSIKL